MELGMDTIVNLNLASILDLKRIVILENASKKEVLDLLIEKLAESDFVKSKKDLQRGIYEREELMSTGIGLSLGIPHVRMNSIKDLVLAAALVRNGIDDYESLDSSKIKLFFMIVAKSMPLNPKCNILLDNIFSL